MKSLSIMAGVFFAQVYICLARHTQFVFEPREHFDSGQDPRTGALNNREPPEPPSWIPPPDYPGDDFGFYYDYGEDKALLLRDLVPQGRESSLLDDLFWDFDEDDDFYYGGENAHEDDAHDIDAHEDDAHDDEAHDDASFELLFDGGQTPRDEDSSSQVALTRVRRRIIPIKAIGATRSDRRNPYGHSRSPWSQPYRSKESVVKRTGPVGSTALYSLFPELAPPEWRERFKKKSKKKRSHHHEGERKFRKIKSYREARKKIHHEKTKFSSPRLVEREEETDDRYFDRSSA